MGIFSARIYCLNVQLGQLDSRKTRILSPLLMGVVDRQAQRRWFWDPRHGWRCGRRRYAPWRGFFLVARPAGRQRQRSHTCPAPASGFRSSSPGCAATRPESKGLCALHPVFIDVHDQVRPNRFGCRPRSTGSSPRTSGRVHITSAGMAAWRIESLHRQMQHHATVLADGIEHHRIGELGRPPHGGCGCSRLPAGAGEI